MSANAEIQGAQATKMVAARANLQRPRSEGQTSQGVCAGHMREV